MQNTQNTIVKGEDFIRSFLISRFKKIIVDIDPSDPKYQNEVPYDTWGEISQNTAHFIIWIDIDGFTLEQIKVHLAHSDFLTSLCGSLRYADFIGKCVITLNERTTIINKKQLDTKLFWDDMMELNKYYYGQSTTAISAAQTPYKSLLSKLFVTKETVDTAIASMPKDYDAIYNSKKHEILNSIDLLFDQITALKNSLKDIEFEYINRVIQDDGNTIFSRLISFLDRCKHVKGYKVKIPSVNSMSNSRCKIDIMLHAFPVSYTCGEELLDKLINKSSRFDDFKNKEILIDALSKRQDYEIYHRPVKITLSVNISANATLDYAIDRTIMSYAELINLPTELYTRFNYANYFENRHYFRYSCLGGFKADIQTAQTNIEPVRLFATLLQYLSTINLADTAGNQWLGQDHLILNKRTGKLCLLKECSGILNELDCNIKDLDNLYLTDYFIKELPYGD